MTTRSTRSPRRRTVTALGVVLIIIVAFGARLFDIQVVSADQNIKDAVSMGLGDSVVLKGTRGAITDSDGTVLAQSTLLYDAQLSPINVKNMYAPTADPAPAVPWDQMAGKIGAITGQSADAVMKIVSDALAKNPDSQFAYLAKGISTEQYRDLAELGLSYLSFTSQPSRVYPEGAVAGNLVGFVGVDGKPLEGLEMAQNSCLQAKNGKETFERGKDGVVIPGTMDTKPAVDGGTLKLTIDSDLQWYMQQLIAEQVHRQKSISGTITVVDVKTGKIKAAAEYPTVDPNNFDAPGSYLHSRIFQNTFEPASTFKALTASVLLDTGKATPLTSVIAPHRVTFPNGAKVVDALSSHGTVDFTLNGVLVESSNVGISTLSQRVPIQTRYSYLQKFGIGAGSAVAFPGEAKGLLYPASQWNNQQIYDTNYGQGISTTIPELMGAYDAIANGGVRVPLQLVESCTKADGGVVTPELPKPVRVMSEKSSHQVSTILENVYTQAGYSKDVNVPGYRVAMKSGTGQKTDGKGHYKSGVWFTLMIGFAPADNPQYIVAVTLDEPKRLKSSGADAEGFQKAVTQVMKTYRVMPSTGKADKLPIYK